MMKLIQKIKCKLGWHRWKYSYMPYPKAGGALIAIRYCKVPLEECNTVEGLDYFGDWKPMTYEQETETWGDLW